MTTETPSAPAIIHSPREQWLELRRSHVGASEVAAILGEDPRRGALAVYASKVQGKVDEVEESWLAFGRDVEAAIAKGYAYTTKREVFDLGAHTVQMHPDLACLGATLDRQTLGSDDFPAPAEGKGPLELKAVGFHKKHEWAAEPPILFQIQLQMQIACTRAAWGSLGALMGGIQIADPVDQLRNDEFIAVAMEAVARFWWHVEHRVPPPADSKPETRAAIRRLWTTNNEEAKAFSQEELALVNAWEKAKADKSKAEDSIDGYVNELSVRLETAGVGLLPDGSSFVMQAQKVKASVCACGKQTRKASERHVPSRWWPQHLKPGRKVAGKEE